MLSHILPWQADLDQSPSQVPSFWEYHTYAMGLGLSEWKITMHIWSKCQCNCTLKWPCHGSGRGRLWSLYEAQHILGSIHSKRDNILPWKKFSKFCSDYFKYLEIFHVFPNRSRHQKKKKTHNFLKLFLVMHFELLLEHEHINHSECLFLTQGKYQQFRQGDLLFIWMLVTDFRDCAWLTIKMHIQI